MKLFSKVAVPFYTLKISMNDLNIQPEYEYGQTIYYFAIHIGVEWYCIMNLIYIFLMCSSAEKLFMCLFASQISVLTFCQFLNWVIYFLIDEF